MLTVKETMNKALKEKPEILDFKLWSEERGLIPFPTKSKRMINEIYLSKVLATSYLKNNKTLYIEIST